MIAAQAVPAESMPSHLAFSPDSRTVFVSLQGTDKLAAIDLTKMEPLWTEPVGPVPAGVLFFKGSVLVADMGCRLCQGIVVVDPKTVQGDEPRSSLPRQA